MFPLLIPYEEIHTVTSRETPRCLAEDSNLRFFNPEAEAPAAELPRQDITPHPYPLPKGYQSVTRQVVLLEVLLISNY
jgi:hypothetical protein